MLDILFPQEPREHLPLRRTPVEAQRKRSWFPTDFDRDPAQYSMAMERAVVSVREAYEASKNNTPPEFTPQLVLKLTLDEGGSIQEEQWQRCRLALLSEEGDRTVVLRSSDELETLQGKVHEYGEPIPDGQKNPRHAWLAAATEDMDLWNRDDRIGPKLTDAGISRDTIYQVEVELWTEGTAEEREDRLRRLRAFVESRNGVWLDVFRDDDWCLARVEIDGRSLNQLLDVSSVHRIDLPPQPSLAQQDLIWTPLDDLNAPTPPPDGAIGICVIDSGVRTGHPQLRPAIGDTMAVGDFQDAVDVCGHGTMVCGLALYGDVATCIDNRDFSPEFQLFVARVTNDDNRFDDRTLIANQMSEAIHYFYDEYACRVFNVSLGDEDLVYVGQKPSSWTYILDHLTRTLDIIIVVSAGNNSARMNGGRDALDTRRRYPDYLFQEANHVIEPAIAANVLTVGSLAHSETARQQVQHPDDPAYRCVAGMHQPSPFTRGGPGVRGAIKPEVCDWGGNLVWEGRGGGRIISRDLDASVISTNSEYLQRLFAVDSGTSYAAPRVAHLAAHILREYPDASANLVRALIVSSAEVPQEAEQLIDDRDELLRVTGYGRPDLDRALYSTDSRVTLIAEDEVPLNNFHIFEVPIPEEFKHLNGQRRITVTLAYDPPVRHTRKEYVGVGMSFSLIRGLDINQVADYYAVGSETLGRYLQANRCTMYPASPKRNSSTVQRARFTARSNGPLANYPGDAFHLVVVCQRKWAHVDDYPTQRYAVVVTIEHMERMVLYDAIRNRVAVPARVRVR